MVGRAFGAVRAAFAYFTILPVGGDARAAPQAAALLALPLVGATVGAVAGALARVAARRYAPPVPVAVAFVVPIVLTGALHLDGFLDGCDALFASVEPARRREILKDPRHGTYALAGLATYAALSLGALASLPADRLIRTLAFAGALSRAAVLPSALLFSYAPGAAPSRLLDRTPAASPVLAWLVVLAFAGASVVPRGGTLVPIATLGALAIARFCARRLGGGLVGDAYGFAIVVLDVALVIAAVPRRAEE